MNLEEIKKRVEGATHGEWVCELEHNIISSGDDLIAEYEYKADGDFIAHAREDMTDLIAEVERLRVLLESYEDAFWDVIEASDLNFKDFLPKELIE